MKKCLLCLGSMLLLMLAIVGTESTMALTELTDREWYDFDTYEELEAWFEAEDPADAGAMEEAGIWGEKYETFVNDVMQGKNKILIPHFGENTIPLQDFERGSSITIATKSSYGRPEIRYYCTSEVENYRITLTYLSDEEVEYAKENEMDEVVRLIRKAIPQVGNWLNVFDYEIYELETMYLNDRDVSVLSIAYYGNPDIEKYFVYDNVLVQIEGSKKGFDRELWGTFRLVDRKNPQEYVPRELPPEDGIISKIVNHRYFIPIIVLAAIVGIIVWRWRMPYRR